MGAVCLDTGKGYSQELQEGAGVDRRIGEIRYPSVYTEDELYTLGYRDGQKDEVRPIQPFALTDERRMAMIDIYRMGWQDGDGDLVTQVTEEALSLADVEAATLSGQITVLGDALDELKAKLVRSIITP
jgi:hypothetical protein